MLSEPPSLRFIAVQRERDLFEVQDHIRGIFDYSLNRRELMLDALDLDRRNGRAFDRREQRPPQGIAYGCTEAAFERLGRESPVAVGQRFAVSGQTTRHLKASPEIVLVHNLPLENLEKIMQPLNARFSSAGLEARQSYLL